MKPSDENLIVQFRTWFRNYNPSSGKPLIWIKKQEPYVHTLILPFTKVKIIKQNNSKTRQPVGRIPLWIRSRSEAANKKLFFFLQYRFMGSLVGLTLVMKTQAELFWAFWLTK
jgi:hypothetical protein